MRHIIHENKTLIKENFETNDYSLKQHDIKHVTMEETKEKYNKQILRHKKELNFLWRNFVNIYDHLTYTVLDFIYPLCF